jgi:hypothetical protein
MTDLLLDDEGDLALVDGQLALVDGIAEVRQSLQQSLRFLKGEWFLDVRMGVPYRDLKEKSSDLSLFRSVVTKVALDVAGVVEILSLTLDFDRVTRELSGTLDVRVDPAVAEGTFTLTFKSVVV